MMQLSRFQISESVMVEQTRQFKFFQIAAALGARLAACLLGVGITSGLAMPVWSATPTTTAGKIDYERCTATLSGLQISADEAASACARAFRPVDLSRCVSTISRGSSISAADALGSCRQVRRPLDMGNCVVDIRRGLSGAAETDVLNNCRSSLLPSTYADCVLGENRSLKLEPARLLNVCIDASDFARDLDPTFIPYTTTPGSSPPSLNPNEPLTPANPNTTTPTDPNTTTPNTTTPTSPNTTTPNTTTPANPSDSTTPANPSPTTP